MNHGFRVIVTSSTDQDTISTEGFHADLCLFCSLHHCHDNDDGGTDCFFGILRQHCLSPLFVSTASIEQTTTLPAHANEEINHLLRVLF